MDTLSSDTQQISLISKPCLGEFCCALHYILFHDKSVSVSVLLVQFGVELVVKCTASIVAYDV